MNILVYGAGVIGSLFAARLKMSGADVTILARKQRLEDINKHGIVLENGDDGRISTTRIKTVDQLDPISTVLYWPV